MRSSRIMAQLHRSGESGLADHSLEPAAGQQALAALLGYIDSELRTRTGELLERVERTLNGSWTEIRDPARQLAMRTATRWLKNNKTAILDALYQRLLSAINEADVAPDLEADAPKLMDDDTLNVLVIRAQMVHKVLARARPEINAMEARLNVLARQGIAFNISALMPGRIADGYLSVLQELGVPDEARSLLMEVYSDRGVEMLAHFYEGINRLLVQRGVLPELSAAQSQPAQDEVEFTLIDDDRLSIFDSQFQALQNRIEQLPFSRWQPGVLMSMNFLPPTTVMTSIHEAAIERVETFFMDLLQDERISMRTRNELSRLGASVLVLSFKEPAQLESERSPVNLFVRQLALLGMRDQESRIDEFERIGAIIGRLVAERGHNIDSFRSGAEALYTIARTEVERRLAEQRQPMQHEGYQT